MKVAILADTHAGCRNDSLAFNEYFLRFYREVFFPYLEKNPVDQIIHVGDVFDRRKYINFQILDRWHKEVFSRLNKLKIPVHIIIGNHDTYFKDTNKVNSVENLLSCYRNFKFFSNPTEISEEICYVPWICDENLEASLKLIDNTKARLCFGHLELKGFDLFPGHTNVDKGFDPSVFDKFDVVYSGHFHHKSFKRNIHYLGSPYPMTWSDWGDRRGFHILETETRNLTFIENPYQIFNKIYYNDARETFDGITRKDLSQYKGMYVKVIVQEKTNPYWFELFLENLQKCGAYDISIIEADLEDGYEENENSVDEAKDSLSILMDYVTGLEVDTNKVLLENLLRDLYIEASNVTE